MRGFMNNVKTTHLENLDDALLIKKEKSKVAESVKPIRFKPMNSLNRMKSVQPVNTFKNLKID